MTNSEKSARSDDRTHELLERELSYSVTLARKDVPLAHLLQYSVGSVIVLDPVNVEAGDPPSLQLEVEGTVLGRGTAVRDGDRLGLRIDELRAPEKFLPEILS